MYDITEHRLFRPHIKVLEDEANKIFKQMGRKFPILLLTDPVCRYFAFNKDDLIKIIRKNGFISYRIVRE